ncbi:MAG: M15 family metallopeptidase [Clostridium sp.]
MRKIVKFIIVILLFLGLISFIFKGEENVFSGTLTRSSSLTLVNKDNPIEDNYNVDDLTTPNVRFAKACKGEEKKMKQEAAIALESLFKGAKKDNITLYANSGYRTGKTQESIYKKTVRNKGKAYANAFVASRGHSEHETGLAMDVTNSNRNFHKKSSEAKWIRENAHKYGFILRYPENKENVTGYSYEPWHIRYVGDSISKKIYKKGITLEEYIQGE